MSNKPEENLDQHYKALEVIGVIAEDLSYVAKSLSLVGSERLAKDLCAMADSLRSSTKDARDAFTEEIMGRWSDGQQASGNMVKAALTGVAIASESRRK